MGVTTKAITFIGREFKNHEEGLAFFLSKIKMTERDLDEMGPDLWYWLETRQKKGYPECGAYSVFRGDENCGYYIGYDVYDPDPTKMQNKIAKASELWQNLFKEPPKIIQAVLYL